MKKTLTFMHHIVREHEDVGHPHAIRILNNFHGFTRKTLSVLEQRRLIRIDGDQWAMTEKGFAEANAIYDQLGSNHD